MDNRPGRDRNSSKLTDKYVAGRGRALKDFARKSPKAEEVEKRKQIQQLIMSGKIFLDKETIDKYLNADKNESGSGSASSSSSQLQLDVEDLDLDLASEKTCSKVPVGCSQLQDQLQTEAININLENHMHKLNSVDVNENTFINDRIPPRFRNKQQAKNFKKQANKPWVNQQKQSNNKKQLNQENGWGESQRNQEPTSTWTGTQNQATGWGDRRHNWESTSTRTSTHEQATGWGKRNGNQEPTPAWNDTQNQATGWGESQHNRKPTPTRTDVHEQATGWGESKWNQEPTTAWTGTQNQATDWGESQHNREPTPTRTDAQNHIAGLDAWNEWEAAVVVRGPISDEDLEDIVVVDDNDNLDDVMVEQYVDALHQETNGNGAVHASSKVTPSRIQALGNLKSTINADSYKVPVGTIPNPPKGPDRWGGSELKNISQPTGWGDIGEDSGNWYDDGSMTWGAPSMSYTGASGGWSWNS